MKYQFELYFTQEELDDAYNKALPGIKEEVAKNLGVDVSNLSGHYFLDYWKRKCHTKWIQGGDWQFLWARSGREPIKWPIEQKAFLDCTKIHLQGCLMVTHDNCDLIEGNHKRYTNICKTCLTPINGCESELYCARCYRQVLNKWRPV